MISFGQNSNAVAVVQSAINKSLRIEPYLVVDGNFGAKTLTRVKLFQGKCGLVQDGIVGPNTLGALFEGVEMTVRCRMTKVQSMSTNSIPMLQPKLPIPQLTLDPIATSWTFDPRINEYQIAMNNWIAWLAKPYPKEPAPTIPTLTLPSTVPFQFPRIGPSLYSTPNPGARKFVAPIPLEGGTYEISGGMKFKPGFKWQEVETKFTFMRVPLIDSKKLEAGVEAAVTTNGDLSIEAKADFKPVKLELFKDKKINLTLMPLISTAISSSGAELFAGGKAALEIHPSFLGTNVQIGLKGGSKAVLQIGKDSRLDASVYPFTVLGTLEFSWGN